MKKENVIKKIKKDKSSTGWLYKRIRKEQKRRKQSKLDSRDYIYSLPIMKRAWICQEWIAVKQWKRWRRLA